ncbi:helix-turn-helix and ligand-binding sensor domain-containing protein [Flammeovirga kamogawensis]|uniref:HTH luxR-type domain-containing protein n=1 Tax=Flammeovirga kamogawensis TaxID=373891 RepID=A0ABX8H3B3_9BACT|nr:hypothetical protein [Flammeovirga kamogawensis]MBB6463576.1 DNA-binding CsgD family transcriptional regulator [Flammeovirga kamogawensis]QWG09802.1 hypothetical protein KM029_19165 [Flammeovirga kamogawensis]TRX65310.1 hypothetical protein EO216_22570 [Flammeovirga kamogawensis]
MTTINKLLWACLTILIVTTTVFSFPFLPKVTSYSKLDYKAGRQNWAIGYDSYGSVYFGNNEGLLHHIYNSWEVIPTSKNDNVKSLLVYNDTIWTGGSIQLGYFAANGFGNIEYNHVANIVKGQVWKIETRDNKIYAQTEAGVYIYNKTIKETSFIEFPKGLYNIIDFDNKIIGIDRLNRIGFFNENDSFVIKDTLNSITDIHTSFKGANHYYIIADKSKLITLDRQQKKSEYNLPKEITDATIFKGIEYSQEGQVVFGTISKGLIFYDYKRGLILNQVNTSNGLIDNTTLCLKSDEIGNIWTGLDYGIGYVENQQIVKSIFNGGATYDFLVKDNFTLLATNKGVFKSDNRNKFQFIPKLSGQTWSIEEINNHLFINHNNGIFSYENGVFKEVYTAAGVLRIVNFKGTNKYILSTYIGLLFAEFDGVEFKEIGNLYYWGNPKIGYDAKEKAIWAKSKEGSLKKYTLTANEKAIETEDYQGQDDFFTLKNKVVFYNGNYLSEYIDGSFIQINTPPLNKISGGGLTRLVVGNHDQYLAFIQNGKLDLLMNIHDGNYYSFNKVLSAIDTNLLEGDECFKFIDNSLWIATDRGVEIFNPQAKSKRVKTPKPFITNVKAITSDTTINYMYPFKNTKLVLNAEVNDLNFNFGILKSSRDFVEFSYKLEGYDTDWSSWSVNEVKEYTQIKGGNYKMRLRSRLNGGVVAEYSLLLSIELEWFETKWMIILYLFVILFLVFLFYLFYKYSTAKKLKKLQLEQQLILDEEKISFKNEQLLKYTELLTQKNQLLRELKDDLIGVKHRVTDLWIKKIDKEMNTEKKSLIFHELFKDLHKDFISKMEAKHPTLTQNDIRLISLIKFNLGNHEIANLMNITQKSVIVNRYRLKKKLELSNDMDLDHYIKEFE